MSFVVRLDRPTTGAVKVGYTTVDDSAGAPGDFVAKTGTVRFATGATTATIRVAIVGDREVEPLEWFSVVLTGVISGPATIGDGTGVGLIVDND